MKRESGFVVKSKKKGGETMKKILLLAAAAMLFAAPAMAGITGTKHDLSSTGGGSIKGASDQICLYCHTPHNANTIPVYSPLWNRTNVNAITTVYSSTTLNNIPVAANVVIAPLCLSCHDGSDIGAGIKESFTYTLGTTPATITNALLNGGADLSDDHPVGMSVVDNADTGIALLATMKGAGFKFFGASEDIMDCATCHNVHDASMGAFLRMSNTGSVLCKSCHTNK